MKRRRFVVRSIALTLGIALVSFAVLGQETPFTSVQAFFIHATEASSVPLVADEPVNDFSDLAEFYRITQYRRAWNQLKDVIQLLRVIEGATDEGLDPDDYHFHRLAAFFFQHRKTEAERIQFDLLLTDSFLSYARDLQSGRVDPEILYAGKYEGSPPHTDLSFLLIKAIEQGRIDDALNELSPDDQQYIALKAALRYYRHLAEGPAWPSIDEGSRIVPGAWDPRIPAIRRRLELSGQLSDLFQSDTLLYDTSLVTAVKKLQYQHGLDVDGQIGTRTVAALNWRPSDYIHEIQVNLERYRWLPRQRETPYITVNIPEFQLQMQTGSEPVQTMKVVVGRIDRQTPELTSEIRYIIINPTWTVPPTILYEDVIPAVQHDPGYLARNKLHVLSANGLEIDPSTIAWQAYPEQNFPYQIRQDPGLNNVLGTIKFQFPNDFSVYLHDTNHRELFQLSDRTLSSGCIRAEKPIDLALFLLNDTAMTRDSLQRSIASGKTSTIEVCRKVGISVVYHTARVDENGLLVLSQDCYDLDGTLLNALSGRKGNQGQRRPDL